MRRRAWGPLVLAVLAGCGELVVEREAVLEAEAGAEQVRFADLDGCCDLIIGAPSRGQVDVVRRRGGEWIPVGSFFAAPDPIDEVLPASVGGRPSLFVRAGGEEVMLLSADLLDAHRLRDPVEVFGGEAQAMAVADLDRDGIDEVVVASGSNLRLVDRTEWALFEDPSDTPDVDVRTIDDYEAGALAVADLTGDGVPEVVAFARGEAEARIFDSPGLSRERRREPRDVELTAPAVAAVSVACSDAPVVAALEDGTVVGLGGEAEQVPSAWPLPSEARSVHGGGDAVVVVYRDDTPATVHGACGRTGGATGLSSSAIVDVTLTPRRDGMRRMAVSREDGRAVTIYQVEAPF